MKKVIILILILFACLQCKTNNEQKLDTLEVRKNQAADSAVIKNDKAVHIYMNANGDVDSLVKAISLLDEALILDSLYSISYANKAHYLTIMGKGKEAMFVIDKAIKNLPQDPQLHFVKGVFYEKEGLSALARNSFNQSISNYNKLIISNPDDFNLLLNRFFVSVFAEDPEKSLKELATLQSKYDELSEEYRQIQDMIQFILNIDKDDYILQFWNQ